VSTCKHKLLRRMHGLSIVPHLLGVYALLVCVQIPDMPAVHDFSPLDR